MKTITLSALLLVMTISLTWSDDAHAASFKVQRGDGEFFETLGTVENTGARSNKFKDSDYFPGTLYYRVICVDADDNELCTHTDVITVTKRG